MKKFHIGATKKLLSAVVALVASIGIATGATFAWFTSNQQVTVSPFTVNVTTGDDNLLIAVTAASETSAADNLFKATIDNTTVTNAINAAVTGETLVKLDALTSTDNGVTLKNSSSTPVDATTGKFATFAIWFKATSATEGHNVIVNMGAAADNAVTSAGNVTASHVAAVNAVTAATYTDDDEASDIAAGAKISAAAANATRIAFLPASGGSNKVWCPNEAQLSGAEFTTGTAFTTAKGWYKNNLASDYNISVKGGSAVSQQSYTGICVTENKSSDSDVQLLTLSSATAVKVVVKIWLEGTDGDCFNSIYNDTITVKLQFVVKASA